jgi:26S proteasome regulatory subunit N1
MTYSDTQPRGTLRYRLLSASLVPVSSPLSEPGSWGHEYVRHLAAELGEEYSSRVEDEGDTPEEVAEKEREREKQQENEKETEGDKAKEGAEQKEKIVVKVVIDASNEELQALGMQCAVFLLGHNAEPDAVDLLEELEIVERIAELVDENTYGRVCAYMIR